MENKYKQYTQIEVVSFDDFMKEHEIAALKQCEAEIASLHNLLLERRYLTK